MRNVLLLTLFILLYFGQSGAQNKTQFGNVNVGDFDDSFGSDAPAVILYDKGTTDFITSSDITIRFVRESRMLIRTKAGFGFAEIQIPYYQDGYGRTEMVDDIVAYTYNIDPDNGLVTRAVVSPSSVYIEDINQYWKMKKFVFPDVREGSILEYRYVKNTPFLFNPPDWEFQQSVPVKESTYQISLTPFYDYTYLLQGATKFDDYETFKSSITDDFAGITYNLMVHRYQMKNLPAFEDESFITSRGDYIVKLDFQLARINYPTGGSKDIMTSWPLINSDFLKSDNFGKYLKQAEKESEDYLASYSDVLKITDKRDRLEALVLAVRKDFEWDGSTDKYAGEKAKDVFKVRKGNSAELNLILCAVLREAGFEAHPVLISTRNHGKVHPQYPFSHYFNDVIAFVTFDEQSSLLDATDILLPYNSLPLRCLNETGLIVEDGGERWVSLETSAQSVEYHYTELDLTPEERTANVISSHRLSGYSAYVARKSIFNDAGRLAQSKLAGSIESLENVEFEDVTVPTKPYIVRFSGVIPLEAYDDKILIQPFLDLVPQETPLKSKERKYPVDMIYRQHNQFVTRIKIPEGYKVIEKPQTININDALAQIQLTYTDTENGLEMQALISFKSAVYGAEHYHKLRSHYLQLVSTFNQPVILQRMEAPSGSD